MESPRPLQALTDDILEEIFVRIGSPADLARASTACVAFRRLIADPSFLPQYRSLHHPLLLGFIDAYGKGFQPVEAPRPSASVARAADFSFEDFLPRVTGARWRPWDVRDSRVLLRCFPEGIDDESFSLDLAVCDPLARRCLLLPPIPDDLVAAIQMHKLHIEDSDAFFVPSGYEGDDTSFRMLVRLVFTERVVTFIFSSADGHWSASASVSWDALGIPLRHREVACCSHAYGCFYWKVTCEDKWLKLDMSSMEIYAFDLPIGHDRSKIIIVEVGEGRLGIFTLDYCGSSLLYYTIRQIGDERSGQLEMDNVIPLPNSFGHYICGPYEGYIFILCYQLPDGAEETCFMLEIKTLEISRVCRLRFSYVYPYFGFPPSMSQRRI